jgi:hypothetical protein
MCNRMQHSKVKKQWKIVKYLAVGQKITKFAIRTAGYMTGPPSDTSLEDTAASVWLIRNVAGFLRWGTNPPCEGPIITRDSGKVGKTFTC